MHADGGTGPSPDGAKIYQKQAAPKFLTAMQDLDQTLAVLRAHLGGRREGESDEWRLAHGVACGERRPGARVQGAIRDAGHHLGGQLVVARSVALQPMRDRELLLW